LLQDDNADPQEYCIFFILEAFGHYLAPKANRNMEREFLKFFKNVSFEQLKNMKWCDFIADFLIEDLIAYKTGKAKGRKCWGCLLILVVSDVLSSEWI
jgi:hypothetical protein